MGNELPRKQKDKKEKGDEKKIVKKPELMSMQLGKKRKKKKGVDVASKLPTITPNTKCLLRLRKFERIKDYLLMEKEYIQNKKVNVKEDENEVEEKNLIESLRGTPINIGTLEEIINEEKAIVSLSGEEFYVNILSIVDKANEVIDEKEAEDILFDTVHDICLDCDSILALDRYADVSKGTIISPKCFHSVSLALYYIRMLGYNSLLRDFDEWNEKVTKAILDSPEYKEMSIYGESEFEYRFRMIKVARRYAYLLLDEKYKKTADPTIEEMLKSKYWCRLDDDDVLKDLIADDPAFGKLVDVLALEANDYCQSDFPPDINDVNDYGKRAVSYSPIDTNVNNEPPF